MFLYEICAAVLFGFSLFDAVLRENKICLLVMAGALITVSAGETFNYIYSTTIYYDNFFMIPFTKIPVFIILSGSIIAAWTYRFAVKIKEFSKIKNLDFVSAFFLSLVFPPLSEIFGVGAGLWRWEGDVQMNLSFFLGIWKFYALFIFLPVFCGLLLGGRNGIYACKK
jgi:hypothetical protein